MSWWKPKKELLKPSKASNLWKISLNKPVKHFYGDSDKDGVMNMFDCAPHNKKKQGSEHKDIRESKLWKEMEKSMKKTEEAKERVRKSGYKFKPEEIAYASAD
jgi:hypothetical protein